jgi:hypothetical protein
LHQASFVVKIDHKPLEWLVIVYDPVGRKGKWISMLQDINFEIVHRARVRHAIADALNRNPVDSHDEDEDFGMEVQDEKKDVNVVHVWNSSALESTYLHPLPVY